MEFKVKGTSHSNKDGKPRQKIIQEVLNTFLENDYIEKSELYGGNSNKEIEEYDLNVSIYEDIPFPAILKKSKYETEDCIEVYLIDYNNNKYKIGYAPKELIVEVLRNMPEDTTNVSANILGKKYKRYDWEEEKVIIDQVDSYGISINMPINTKQVDNIENTQTETVVTKSQETKQYNKGKHAKTKYNKDIVTELVVCILLGIFGGHKFYKGQIGMGLVYLFTGGLLGIGWIIDIIKIVSKLAL